MSFHTTFWANLFTTAYLIFVPGCVAQKVYFDCGARVDVVDVQGLILSPGFPYNYSSGTHCVWQFFVPVGHQLFLEVFDFDVFESHDVSEQYGSVPGFDDEAYEGVSFSPAGSDDFGPPEKESGPQTDVASKVPQGLLKDEAKHVVVQEESSKMELARVSNSARRSSDAPSYPASSPLPPHPLLPGAQPPGDKAANSASPAVRGDPNPGLPVEESPPAPAPSSSTASPTDSPETQQSVLDTCPHDVLYISDLITFSSRFCGSNRPSSSQLVFGSSQEMVEVIMELITTTHWGRGFALLFHYHNRTAPAAGGGDRHAYSPPSGTRAESMLAAVGGAAFCAMVLTSALCVIFRPKLCPKRASSCSSNNSEVQDAVQSQVTEASELRLVVPNRAGLDVPAEDNNSRHPSPGLALTHTGSNVCVGGDASQNAELELPSNGLTELDLGTDEVFIISSSPAPGPAARPEFSLRTQRERFLRHSDTGPVKDWPSPDPAASGAQAAPDGPVSCARPRAWSVRTFQDFLPALPQLHKKWCSWNSTSPFTKLVDSAPASLLSDCRSEDNSKVFSDVQLDGNNDNSASDSCSSSASYPLSQPAQRQRRLNSISNLRRTRFTGPCFGLLSPPPEPVKTPHLQAPSAEAGSPLSPPQVDGDHVSVPVFAISEEEDRQPLVLAEHQASASSSSSSSSPPSSSMLNGLRRAGAYDGKGSAPGSSLPRGRSEWRPWGSQASGGASPLPLDSPTSNAEAKSTFRHVTAGQTQLPSLSQSTVPYGVAGKEM